MLLAIQILLGVLFAGTGVGLVVDVAKNRMDKIKDATGKQWASAFVVGIIANFLDTLGCGSYAPSTFMYKLFNQIDDIDIPGTLNVGDTFPVIFEAFIFTTSVTCDPMFLIIMFVCAAVGSFGFASIVTKWPQNRSWYSYDSTCCCYALQEYRFWTFRSRRNFNRSYRLEINRSRSS